MSTAPLCTRIENKSLLANLEELPEMDQETAMDLNLVKVPTSLGTQAKDLAKPDCEKKAVEPKAEQKRK